MVCFFHIFHGKQQIQGGFAEVAERFAMSWELHDTREPMRVLLMVSKYDHCLADLLFRSRMGELPIEIAAVIVWQVVDSAEAVFNVDDYESFVHIQSEAALRAMASSYPYDQHEEGQIALSSGDGDDAFV